MVEKHPETDVGVVRSLLLLLTRSLTRVLF